MKTNKFHLCIGISRMCICHLFVLISNQTYVRSSPSEVSLGKGVLNICSKFTGEHPCQSAISIKLICNFIEIALRHGCSPVNLLHIFRTSFPKNTSEGSLLIRSILNVQSEYQVELYLLA